jgi:hypothetical protein
VCAQYNRKKLKASYRLAHFLVEERILERILKKMGARVKSYTGFK